MRQAHPNLYLGYLTCIAVSVASGLNLIILTPPFMPISIDKWLIGMVFLSVGLIELALLLRGPANRNWLRASMALTVLIYLFWAVLLTYDWYDRSLTSLQLPVWVIGGAAWSCWLLREPFKNPASAKLNGNGDKQ